ncbi:hypothetical protein CBL_08155 [Carabus blaptoides fortunei]
MSESNKNEEGAVSNIRNPELMRIHLKNNIEEIAGGISLEEFQTIVATLGNKTSAAKKLYNMQKSAIVNDIHQGIEYMCKESSINSKYNEITNLINTSQVDTNTQSWRPIPGDCEMQLYRYRRKILEDKKDKLEKLVQEEQRLRLLMQSTVDKKRSFFKEQQTQMFSAKTKLIEYNNAVHDVLKF